MTAQAANEDLELEVDVAPGPDVEIDLDTGEAAAPATEVAAEPAKEPAKVEPVEDEGVKSLREQLAAATAAREEAERLRRAEAERADKAEKQNGESQYQVVLSAMEAVKREGEQAEADLAKALEEGRYADVAKHQRVLARVESRLDQLESAKANFSEPKVAKAEGTVKEPEPVRQQQPVDPVEALAAQLSAKSAAWVRQHPECAQDPVVFQEMIAADARARRQGFVPDTPQYFDFLEKRLGFKEEPQPAKEEKEPVVETKRNVMPAAPVSREVPGTPVGSRRVVLTAEEQEIAQMNGMTNKEYAEQKAAYMAEKARA